MNNAPVPIDINWARTYQERRYQGRVTALNEPGGPKSCLEWGRGNPGGTSRGFWFKCSQMGHFAQNCPQRPKRANINLINLQEEGPSNDKIMPARNRVASIKEQLTKMTDKERGQLAKEMRVAEDFPTA
jgi:zinc knuckle protein